ncbi:hypothetical protein MHBO_002190 [Bonamia ostreae]|uniref:Uncharacterized protein n=1 Tax=Bonamia ostreae TaxID=126728 RepID=A0ABV2ALI1_9EUKA
MKIFLSLIFFHLYRNSDKILDIPCHITGADDFSFVDTVSQKDLGNVEYFPDGSSVFLQCKNNNPLFNITSNTVQGYMYIRCESGRVYNEWNVRLNNTKKDLLCEDFDGFKSCKKPELGGMEISSVDSVFNFPSNTKYEIWCEDSDMGFLLQCVGSDWVIVHGEDIYKGEDEIKILCDKI